MLAKRIATLSKKDFDKADLNGDGILKFSEWKDWQGEVKDAPIVPLRSSNELPDYDLL